MVPDGRRRLKLTGRLSQVNGSGRRAGTAPAGTLGRRQPGVQPLPHLLRRVRPPPPFLPGDRHPGGGHADETGQTQDLPPPHAATVRPVPITLDEALRITRTGDIWVFRGRSAADRAIRLSTNSPVNHVGMTVALDDLPALMWHAELGR